VSPAQVVAIPPQNLDAESSVLGALMVREGMDAALAEAHLEPDHFYRETHRLIFRAMLGLHQAGSAIDAITVSERLKQMGKLEEVGGKDSISQLASTVPAPGNLLHYARIVVEEAEWRLRQQAGHLIEKAVANRDPELLSRAEDCLRTDIVYANADLDAEAQAEVAYSLLEGRAAADFPYPWGRLNHLTNGGMRRGQLIVISGYSNFGKSFIVDQLLDTIQKHNRRGWLYFNEMTQEERVARKIARYTGISYDRFVAGKLEPDGQKKVLDQVNEGMGWGMTDVSGRSPEDVCHHIRRTRPDVAAIDLLNRFDWADERECSRIVTMFNDTAKLAGCALILVCQLNERVAGAARAIRSAVFKPPVYTDLKGTGDIKNHADHVLFLHRSQHEETGEPLADGTLYFGKVRGGKRGGLPVHFQESHLRFLPAAPKRDAEPVQGALA
jgi:replicative DNA helicase